MRFLFAVLFALSLCHVGFGEDIKVSKADTQHFMGVVDYLQGALYSAGQKLNTPEGVREYRDLMRVLRLHQETVGGIRADLNSNFARFMWEANPWINRNLGFADGDEGSSKFKAAWALLDTYSDVAIADSEKFRAQLKETSDSIMGASGLELVTAPPEPQAVTISDAELEAAVAFAALGVASYPVVISGANPEHTGALAMVDSTILFQNFLRKEKALAVLKRRAKFSIHAAVALSLIENKDFPKALDKVVTTLEQKQSSGGSREPYYVIREGQLEKYKGFTALLHGASALAREEAEAALPPSKIMDLPAGKKAVGTVVAKKGPLDEDEARVVSSIVNQMFEDLKGLAGAADVRDVNNSSFRGLRNDAYSLKMLLLYFAKNERNHLRRHFYNVNPWAMRNWMSLTEGASGTSTLDRLAAAINNLEPLDEILGGIHGTNIQESVPGAAPQDNRNVVNLATVGQQEILVTETYALGTVALGLQSMAANLVNLSKAKGLTGSYAHHVTTLIRNGISLLAARHERLKFVLAQYQAQQTAPFEIKEVRSAVALVENLGKVLGALTFLENGFVTIDAADGSAPFTLQEGARTLYELVVRLQVPQLTSAGTPAEGGFCLGNLDGLGRTKPE